MPRKLLIVDDHPVNRTLAKVLLRGTDWDCAEAGAGEEALEMLASGSPGRGTGRSFDTVLLDISMPGLSGDEVCRRIRAEASLKHLLVVAYTAHALEEERGQMLAAGFDALLIKPITRESLLDALA